MKTLNQFKSLFSKKTVDNQLFKQKNKIHSQGFTLVEIMIVLVILGGLFTLLGGRVFGQRDRANVTTAKIQISKITSAIELFYNDCDQYPQSLTQLVQKPGEDVCENWQPKGYLKNEKELKDPWKTEFLYEVEGGGFIVRSLGKNKAPGGADYDADISSEDL